MLRVEGGGEGGSDPHGGMASSSLLRDVSIERHLWPHREPTVTDGEEAVVGYFLMTSVNADAVRRSNALLGYSGAPYPFTPPLHRPPP